jgi:hypothetical protein
VALFFSVLHFLAPGKEISSVWGGLAAAVADAYLDRRTRRR